MSWPDKPHMGSPGIRHNPQKTAQLNSSKVLLNHCESVLLSERKQHMMSQWIDECNYFISKVIQNSILQHRYHLTKMKFCFGSLFEIEILFCVRNYACTCWYCCFGRASYWKRCHLECDPFLAAQLIFGLECSHLITLNCCL